MDEQEFLNGVQMKINVLQYEREMQDIIQEKQKRHFYRKIMICIMLFSAVAALIICAAVFSIDLGFIIVISVALLIISVWIETNDFEIKKIETGVRKSGYSYK
jgi:fatty-acid desaturase